MIARRVMTTVYRRRGRVVVRYGRHSSAARTVGEALAALSSPKTAEITQREYAASTCDHGPLVAAFLSDGQTLITSTRCRRWTRATGCLVCFVLYTEVMLGAKLVGWKLTAASIVICHLVRRQSLVYRTKRPPSSNLVDNMYLTYSLQCRLLFVCRQFITEIYNYSLTFAANEAVSFLTISCTRNDYRYM